MTIFGCYNKGKAFGGYVMKISIKNMYSHNYASQFWLSFGIVAPIFGLCALLSVGGVLPKFPLTENMTMMTAALIMLLCIGITIVGIIRVRTTIAKLSNIITNGKLMDAVITDVFALKHQVSVSYEFVYDGETCKDKHNLSRKSHFRTEYKKGKELKIYALKNSDGKILTAPDVY